MFPNKPRFPHLNWLRRFIGTVALLFLTVWLMAQPSQPAVVGWQKQLAQTSADSTRLRLCLTIAQYYYNKTQYDSLYPYVQRGLQLLPKSPSHEHASELNFLMSRYYRSKSQSKKGIPYGEQSVKHALLSHHPKRTAELQYYLSVLYSDAGELSKAVELIGTNLRYLQQHDDGPTRGANYLLIMNLFLVMNDTTREKLYWEKYLALDKRSWPAEDKMLAYLNIGGRLEGEGRLKEAEGQFRQALYYATLTPAPAVPIIESMEGLGANARKQGQYQTAIVWLQRAFWRAESIKNVALMSDIKRALALTYLTFHKPQQALRAAQYALLLARQHKIKEEIIIALNSLGAVLEAQGQSLQALKCYREELQLKEQQFTEVNVQKIALMQAQFDTETKENTIKLLQKNAQINQLNGLHQQEQLALARQTQVVGSLLIVLLLSVIGLTIYSLRKSRLNNDRLNQQQALLQQTASQLAETNSVKDKLFSLIAHDLRSPVANMKNSLCQIREPNQHPDQLMTLHERLDKQVDNLLVLLTNLLDWSMIQLKVTHPPLKPVPLFEVVTNVLSQASDQIEQKQLSIINQVDHNHVALTNTYQLEGVVRNLMGNAIKFTPTGGYIRLATYQAADRVELQVQDSGLGMSAEQIANLFTTPDIRPGTQGEKGTGLGLRLCREMLERQGGQLQIKSREGRGTSVRVQLLSP